jgi:hypothetical protein
MKKLMNVRKYELPYYELTHRLIAETHSRIRSNRSVPTQIKTAMILHSIIYNTLLPLTETTASNVINIYKIQNQC